MYIVCMAIISMATTAQKGYVIAARTKVSVRTFAQKRSSVFDGTLGPNIADSMFRLMFWMPNKNFLGIKTWHEEY